MMAKVATITLNAAYDLVGRLKRIELGEVNTVETLGLFPAGKGINVAKVLKDLGVDVTVGGFLGEDNQGDFVALFDKLGLQDKFQRVPGRTRSSSAPFAWTAMRTPSSPPRMHAVSSLRTAQAASLTRRTLSLSAEQK